MIRFKLTEEKSLKIDQIRKNEISSITKGRLIDIRSKKISSNSISLKEISPNEIISNEIKSIQRNLNNIIFLRDRQVIKVRS